MPAQALHRLHQRKSETSTQANVPIRHTIYQANAFYAPSGPRRPPHHRPAFLIFWREIETGCHLLSNWCAKEGVNPVKSVALLRMNLLYTLWILDSLTFIWCLLPCRTRPCIVGALLSGGAPPPRRLLELQHLGHEPINMRLDALHELEALLKVRTLLALHPPQLVYRQH